MASDVNSRRAARQKKARQRQLKILLIFFIVIAIVTLVVMCFTVFFQVQVIKSTGSKIYSGSQIGEASKVTGKDSLFFVSEEEIEENVRQKCPYIDSVKLERVFPNEIHLIVTDAKENAYYLSGDKYYLISEKGYILKEQNEAPENVFQIKTNGINGKPGQKAEYKNIAENEVVTKLIEDLRKYDINIDVIDVTSLLQIELQIEDKYTVLLGKNEYISDKIKHLSSMLDNITDNSDIIDLSMWQPDNRQGTTRKSGK